ncbi:MAG TPA: hypothetical protein VHW02_09850 [Rhizomicrobium sp.]|jgi:hypothetical protein|nr:hypothetical protein [Rhizomicrobium sp.]
MRRYSQLVITAAAFALLATAAQAKTKVEPACFYESGQSNGKPLSDYTIMNTASFAIPKGTVVTFTTSGAPGKTFTATAPKDIAPQDDFSTGGNIPPGSCDASWLK